MQPWRVPRWLPGLLLPIAASACHATHRSPRYDCPVPPPTRAVVVDTTSLPAGSLRVRAVTASNDSLVYAVRVRLSGPTSRDTSAVGGDITVPNLPSGRYELRTMSIAHFPRADSLRLAPDRGASVLVPLDLMWSDWCGMGDITVRHP
jgi:hypothetical protein